MAPAVPRPDQLLLRVEGHGGDTERVPSVHHRRPQESAALCPLKKTLAKQSEENPLLISRELSSCLSRLKDWLLTSELREDSADP